MPATDRTVALVGRPNVGKSRLFNRLAGRRIAIVHDQPGVTRDVNAVDVREGGYILLDTGGIGLVADMKLRELVAAAEEQVWFALETASLICMVVDAREGLMPLDEEIAARLRASGREVLLVVNKADNEFLGERTVAFSRLGLGEGVPVSAEHGYNESGLREAIIDRLGPPPSEDDAPPERFKIAFAGRPNVGKSSLCNALLRQERLVVSEVPGTTRDAVELNLDYKGRDGSNWPFLLVDTAGLRKRGRLDTSVEFFSGLRTHDAIGDADIVFLVIEALSGVTRLDKAIAGEVAESGRCLAVVVNKWDEAVARWREEPVSGYDTIEAFRAAFAESVRAELFFYPECPVVFTSAKTGHAIGRLLQTARRFQEVSGRTLPTPRVNALVERLFARRAPRVVKGKRFRVYYAVQTRTRPFTFRLFCNRATKLDDGYRRYLQTGFTKEFNLGGCPVRFDLRGKTVRYANKKS